MTMTQVETLEDLLALKPRVLDVPADGHVYHVRRCSFADRIAITTDAAERAEDQNNPDENREFSLILLSRCLCSAHGVLIGAAPDHLRQMDAQVVDLLAEESLKLNKLAPGGIDAAKKFSWPIRICSLLYACTLGLAGRLKRS